MKLFNVREHGHHLDKLAAWTKLRTIDQVRSLQEVNQHGNCIALDIEQENFNNTGYLESIGIHPKNTIKVVDNFLRVEEKNHYILGLSNGSVFYRSLLDQR